MHVLLEHLAVALADRRHRGRHQARAGHLGHRERGREVLGASLRAIGQPRGQGRADCLLRRADRVPRGDRGDLGAGNRADLRGAPDQGGEPVCLLR